MLSLLSSPPQLSLTRPSSPSPGSRHNTASPADCRASTALQRVAFGLTAASVSDKKGLQCSVRSAVIFLAGQYFKAISGEETVCGEHGLPPALSTRQLSLIVLSSVLRPGPHMSLSHSTDL